MTDCQTYLQQAALDWQSRLLTVPKMRINILVATAILLIFGIGTARSDETRLSDLLDCAAHNGSLFHLVNDLARRSPESSREGVEIVRVATSDLIKRAIVETEDPTIIEEIQFRTVEVYKSYFFEKEFLGEIPALENLQAKSSTCWRRFIN